MKRFAVLMTAFLALILLVSACAPATPSTPAATLPAPQAATAALPTAVQDTSIPQKIISLAPSNTEILFAVGAGSQVIARDDFSNYPEDAKRLPSVGGNMGKYDLEKITSLAPDLVLVSPLNSPDQVKAFEGVAKKVVNIPNPKTLDDLYANLTLVGQLTGHTADAEKLVASLKARVKVVTDKLAGVSDRPKVFYEIDGSEPAKPWTAGPGSFIDLLINMAGGQNAAAALNSDYVQISQEALIIQNPDVILLGDSLYGVTAEQVAARPGWDVLKAVKDDRVLPFNDDLVSRPGPRLVDGLEAIAKILHPDLFK